VRDMLSFDVIRPQDNVIALCASSAFFFLFKLNQTKKNRQTIHGNGAPTPPPRNPATPKTYPPPPPPPPFQRRIQGLREIGLPLYSLFPSIDHHHHHHHHCPHQHQHRYH